MTIKLGTSEYFPAVSLKTVCPRPEPHLSPIWRISLTDLCLPLDASRADLTVLVLQSTNSGEPRNLALAV